MRKKEDTKKEVETTATLADKSQEEKTVEPEAGIGPSHCSTLTLLRTPVFYYYRGGVRMFMFHVPVVCFGIFFKNLSCIVQQGQKLHLRTSAFTIRMKYAWLETKSLRIYPVSLELFNSVSKVLSSMIISKLCLTWRRLSVFQIIKLLRRGGESRYSPLFNFARSTTTLLGGLKNLDLVVLGYCY